jgi:flagellar basal-body rod protein FlgF
MDRSLYVSMSGAKETLRAQTANAHNLANVSTTGFRADLTAFMARNVTGPGFASRAYATTSTVGWDGSNGAMLQTGRDLDVAIRGPGWIAVQDGNGGEAYTRAGDLQIDSAGQLRTGAGHPVIGDSGPLIVPPDAALQIGVDGTVSIVPAGQKATTVANVARIKLVNPAESDLQRGTDGLFRLKTGVDAPSDPAVRVASGMLEASNVNAASAMVDMIELSRRFDLQIKSMKTADDNSRAAQTLLRMV